jgi:Pro-kumamolisin, activation domain/Cell wall binding domain 2 (CWB2)
VRQINRASLVAAVIAGTMIASTVAANATALVRATAPGPVSVGSAPVVPFGAHLQSAAPADQQLAFDVVLRPRDQAGLDNFVSAVSTPGSPSYRQFLPTGEFGARFGATASTVAGVTASLKSLGLTVGTLSGSILPVSGSLTRVSSAFHTSFRQYQLASGRIAHANTAAPALPGDIAAVVQAVVGLDDLATFQRPTPKLRAAASSGSAAHGLFSPSLVGPTPCAFIGTNAGNGYYTANQLASYYGLSSLYTAGTLGSGVTVAILELEPFAASDIAAYQTCYGTSTSVSTTNVDGGPGVGPGGGESALDIEDVIGLAPQAAIRVYQGPDATVATSSNVLDVYNAIATDNTAQVVSTSWGLCEAGASHAVFAAERVAFQQMAAQGQTVFAAAGDAGSADCDRNPAPSTGPNTSSALAVDDPASQPEVTGVGGTDLVSTSGPEAVWNEGKLDNGDGTFSISAGGGGRSTQWQMPGYQTALGVISGSSGSPCAAPSGVVCREVPDVSASADPFDGYAVFVQGGWFVIGGTSAAAPTWAALLALIDATCGAHRLGLINPALYQLRTANAAAFHDVTSGNNDGVGLNGGAFGAVAGYDMANGLGSPAGAALSAGLCPTLSADGSGTATVDHTGVGISTNNTLTFTYTAPASQGLTNGELTIAVPATWSAPSTTTSAAGYTTASAGVVSIVGTTIHVKGVTAIAGGTVKIVYGDKSGGGPGAAAPATLQTSTFTTSQRATLAGVLTAVAVSPQVAVGVASDGSGTMTVAPTSVALSAVTSLVFTYTPSAGTGITGGGVTVVVPSGWTAPQHATPSAAGYVTASAGTITVTGSTITIDPVTIPISGTLTITYGATSGGGPGTTAPSTNTTSQFVATQKSTTAFVALAGVPTVVVGTGGGIVITGGGGGGAPPALTLIRVSGADRVATSVEASKVSFPDAGSADAVVLARSDSFADALSGTPLASASNGPLLLTASAALDPAAKAEIQRVLPVGQTVYLLGGSAALSPSIGSALIALGYDVVRFSGADRYATAVAVADGIGFADSVFEADGTNFPDALSAGSAAASIGAVVLLTAGSHQSAATAGFLAANPGLTRYAIGGPAAAADPSATKFVGADRYATAVLVAQAFFGTPDSVGLASGVSFPDALSGGSVVAMNNGPILLVPNAGLLPASVSAYLTTAKASATDAWLFGGPSSVGADVFTSAAGLLAAT